MTLRIATWNVVWMTRLFDARGHLQADEDWSGLWGVTRAEQLDALSTVLPALDADALLIVEAPDDRLSNLNGPRTGGRTVSVLERLAAALDLRARKAVIGFANETEQEIALLYDPDVLRAHHDPVGEVRTRKGDDPAPRFDGTFRIDLDIDDTPDVIEFSKPPLELAVSRVAGGPRFRMIGVHVKSKAPHGARGKDDATRIAIANRRKQLAQCIWLRRRVEGHLSAGESVILLGDMNDGPGLDAFEALFGRSGLEIVMGDGAVPEMRLFDPHAQRALGGRLSAQATSARFYIQPERRWLTALLDYILVSPDLAAVHPAWRIWHPFDDAEIYETPALRDALLKASDHFPVSVDLPI